MNTEATRELLTDVRFLLLVLTDPAKAMAEMRLPKGTIGAIPVGSTLRNWQVDLLARIDRLLGENK